MTIVCIIILRRRRSQNPNDNINWFNNDEINLKETI